MLYCLCLHILQENRYKLQQKYMKGTIETSPAVGARVVFGGRRRLSELWPTAEPRDARRRRRQQRPEQETKSSTSVAPCCHSCAAASLSLQQRSHTATDELVHAAGHWAVAVGGRTDDGADEDDRPEMGNENQTELEWQIIQLQQHYHRAL
jgi:hypothetical protein